MPDFRFRKTLYPHSKIPPSGTYCTAAYHASPVWRLPLAVSNTRFTSAHTHWFPSRE